MNKVNEINYAGLPEQYVEDISRYIEIGLVGNHRFLYAVIANNLFTAMTWIKSDFPPNEWDKRWLDVMKISTWLYNEAPGDCWGGSEKFRVWSNGRCI